MTTGFFNIMDRLPASRRARGLRQAIRGVTLGVMILSTLTILGLLAVILGNIVRGGASRLSWQLLSRSPENGMMEGGIFPAIFGTLVLVLLMTLAVMPLGVLTAVYLREYTHEEARLPRLVRGAVNNLAGVPSVVFGLFGVGFFIQFVGRGLDHTFYGGSLVFGQPALVWASLTLAVLTLPVVIVTTDEALKAVPRELRDASLALGATQLQTLWRVVLPQALPGILTGAILAIARGAGEVAPIMLTGAAYYLPHLPTQLNHQFMELGYHIYVLATQSPDVDAALPMLYATVLVLLLLTGALNLTAIGLRSLMRARLSRTA